LKLTRNIDTTALNFALQRKTQRKICRHSNFAGCELEYGDFSWQMFKTYFSWHFYSSSANNKQAEISAKSSKKKL
jgi:hypothetical protein